MLFKPEFCSLDKVHRLLQVFAAASQLFPVAITDDGEHGGLGSFGVHMQRSRVLSHREIHPCMHACRYGSTVFVSENYEDQ